MKHTLKLNLNTVKALSDLGIPEFVKYYEDWSTFDENFRSIIDELSEVIYYFNNLCKSMDYLKDKKFGYLQKIVKMKNLAIKANKLIINKKYIPNADIIECLSYIAINSEYIEDKDKFNRYADKYSYNNLKYLQKCIKLYNENEE